MTISKRVRYAVLQRDNHTCRYCGATAPDVKLQVDHVIPAALGGTDEPSNLVTACEPCNNGKTSTSPADAVVAQVADEAWRWAEAIKIAATTMAGRREDLRLSLETWQEAWERWHIVSTGEPIPLPDDWRSSITSMLQAGADLALLEDLVSVAMNAKAQDTFRYFCGCAWRQIRDLQDEARRLLTSGAFDDILELTVDPQSAPPVDTAYELGHAAGYGLGYEDGWEAGRHAAEARRDDPVSEPASIATILRQLKEGPPDGEDPRHQA